MSRSLVVSVALVAAALAATALIACAGAPAPTAAQPTAAPAKPAEAPKPAATAAPAKPAEAPKPAAAAAPTKPAEAAKPAATAAPAKAAAFPKTDAKVSITLTADASATKGLQKFADLMKERTGGAVTVQVFPNSQLGNERDMIDQLKTGVLQLGSTGVPNLATIPGWEPVGVLSMPFLFKGDSEETQLPNFIKLSRGPIFQELNDKVSKSSSIRLLDLGWWYGLRQTTTKATPILKPEDAVGRKMRAPDTPIHKLALQMYGASVVGMSFAELYTGLQMGVVDGQQNPLNTIYTSKFYEVQKHLSLLGDMTIGQPLVVSDKFYQGLSPELQAIFDRAARDAGDYQNDLQVKANTQNLQDLKDKGMVINTVDRALFAEKTKDAYKQFEDQFGKGFFEKVKATQQ